MNKFSYTLFFKRIVTILVIFFIIILPTTKKISLKGYERKIDNSLATNSLSSNLNFSTYFGGISYDVINGISFSNNGNYYVIGETQSEDFPTENGYFTTYNGSQDVFISKFSVNNSLIWSTYFGGNNTDYGKDIAVDYNGDCYVIGSTGSVNFPIKNAIDSFYNGSSEYGYGDCFVSKLSANGTLIWSTYLGGSDNEEGYGVSVDTLGNCYITGGTTSSDFPILNAYNSTYGGSGDVFVAKLSSDGDILWSTYLGGSNHEAGWGGISVSNAGNCYITGLTYSLNFPTMNAYYDSYNGACDMFVSKLSPEGSLIWSTYLGGNRNDLGLDIIVTNEENCYVTGMTNSINIQVKNGFDSSFNGGENSGDGFIAKFTEDGSLEWSTYLGGEADDTCWGIDVDNMENCYVTGYTVSSNFPIKRAFLKDQASSDAFITKLDTNGQLLWSTYLGGSNGESGKKIVIDQNNYCFVVGTTNSLDFPVLYAFDNSLNGESDAFITIFGESSKGKISPYYGFLSILIIIPIPIIVIWKRKKKIQGN